MSISECTASWPGKQDTGELLFALERAALLVRLGHHIGYVIALDQVGGAMPDYDVLSQGGRGQIENV
jgi:hypothetical protein